MIYEPPRLEHLGNLRTVVGMFSSTSGGVLGTTSPPPGLANTGGLLPNTGDAGSGLGAGGDAASLAAAATAVGASVRGRRRRG